MTDQVNHTTSMTEEDMAKVRSLFARGADAIVSASQLSKDVEELRHSMSELKQSYDELASHNRFLLRRVNEVETELEEVKKDRDNLRLEASHYNQRLAERDDTIRTLENSVADNATTIARLTKESDDHMFRAMDAEDKLDQVKAKFTAAQSWFEDVNSFLHPAPIPVEEPKAEEVPPLPEGVNVVVLDSPEKVEELHEVIADAVGESGSEPSAMPWRYGVGAS